MKQADKATPTDWRDGALKEYERDMEGMQRQLAASRELNSELLAALEALSGLQVKGHALIDRLQFSNEGRDLSVKITAAIARAKAA
jgi:hypothetical protein